MATRRWRGGQAAQRPSANNTSGTPYKSAGLWAGLGVVGAVDVIDWPVAAAIGVVSR